MKTFITQTSDRYLVDIYLRPVHCGKLLSRLSTAFVQLLTILAALLSRGSPVTGWRDSLSALNFMYSSRACKKQKHRYLPGTSQIPVISHLQKISHHPRLHVVHDIDGSSSMRLEVFEVAKHDVMNGNGHPCLWGAKTPNSAFPRYLPDT